MTRLAPTGPGAPAPGAGPPSSIETEALLLRRATFGFSRQSATRLSVLGHDQWLAEQLDPDSIDDSRVDQMLAAHPWLGMSMRDLVFDRTETVVERADKYKSIRLIRAVHSERQLFERVVEFWSNHFSIFMGRFQRFTDDRDVFRPLALGRFGDLLKVVSKSVSMQAYLDNQLNVAGAPNENLAREILELHTLGVTGPYTETDVREFARVLTGWTFSDDRNDLDFGIVTFDPTRHDFGPKTVLGLQFPGGGGASETDEVLAYLAMHPTTIEYVLGRMGQFFLGDDAPATALERARRAWVATNGDIKKIVTALLGPESIAETLQAGSSMVRRPFDWLAAIYRATGLPLPDLDVTLDLMRTLGQAPFEWGPPDGYPLDRPSWVGLVQPRWSTAAKFSRATDLAWGHGEFDLINLVNFVNRNVLAVNLDNAMTGGSLSAPDVAEIQAHIDSFPPQTPDQVIAGEAFELLFSSPSFQVL